MIRKPVFASYFYPQKQKQLKNMLNFFWSKTKVLINKNKEKVKILIVPHAGYIYSGQTASWGFKQIEKQNFKNVIILGCSHHLYFKNIALDPSRAWRTPLGKVNLNQNLNQKLLKEKNFFYFNFLAHKKEHSLEVQIPFLQMALKNFTIVPLLMGEIEKTNLKIIAEKLAGFVNRKTLFLISSDLSHYPDYRTATEVDKETIKAIMSGSLKNFEETLKKNSLKEGVETCACADKAIKIALLLKKILQLKSASLFHYANSGDVSENKTQVVGYASIGFF